VHRSVLEGTATHPQRIAPNDGGSQAWLGHYIDIHDHTIVRYQFASPLALLLCNNDDLFYG
jgi:hypothetical protein